MANFDTSIRPQDDFYQYVNGTWLEKTEIPADKSNYGAFTELYDKAQKDLRVIIEEAANLTNRVVGTDEQKVGDFYLSYMDTLLTEELGISPLKAEMERIKGLESKEDVVQHIAHCIKTGIETPLYFFINQDLKQSDQYISYIHQSGIGLPDRDYYFREDEKFKEIRKKYLVYIEKLLQLAGIENAGTKAQRIMEMEVELAKGHWTRVENRDRIKTYNKYEIKKLDSLTPDFNWSVYIQEAEIPEIPALIVRQPSYLEKFNKIFKQSSVADWQIYFTYKLLDGAAPILNQDFVDLRFDFHSKTLSGIEEQEPRWKRAVNAVNSVLGEVVGKVYVKKHFKPEAKARMVELVHNLQLSFEDRINQLDWMSSETKQQALHKLMKFIAKIGYPDKWKDYSKLQIKKDELVLNYKRSNLVEYEREIQKLGKPIDRDEWFMTPQTVNAYYNPPMNEVVFPAAILQPPFFNMQADDAVNYGAIGAVIGHELTHGFDDQGRRVDGTGNLRDWWTEEDEKRFKERAQILVKQYAAYNPLDTLHLNGELTLGENIADLGGLTISYNAYKKSLKGIKAPVIDGLSGDQRFFLGWAQVWRRKYRDEELRRRILTDPHSPSRYRVVGVVANMPEFYAAFDLKEGDKLYRPEETRVKIW
jgi:predicted metalloendopeptidase